MDDIGSAARDSGGDGDKGKFDHGSSVRTGFCIGTGRSDGRQRGEHDRGEVARGTRVAQRALDEIGDPIGEVLAAACEALEHRGLGQAQRRRDITHRALVAVV